MTGRGVVSTTITARTRAVTAALVVVLGVLLFAGADAFAAGTLHPSVSKALAQAEVVSVSGSGFAPSAFGYILECNETPGEPTVPVGAPFDQRIPVGCSGPSLKHIVATGANGSLATTFQVHLSRRLGPPCSPSSIFGGCGPSDSAGKRPRADAQNYPCPPSPAQQDAKVTCALVFYDTAHEKVSTPISFVGGGGPPVKTPPASTGTTTPGSTVTTKPGSPGGKSPSTTRPGSTVTTRPITRDTAPPTTRAPATVAPTGDGGSSTSGDPAPSISTTPTKTVQASSGSLAFTGLGHIGQVVALLGLALVVFGLVMLFANVRRIAQWFLGR
jgi:hypothetical protein